MNRFVRSVCCNGCASAMVIVSGLLFIGVAYGLVASVIEYNHRSRPDVTKDDSSNVKRDPLVLMILMVICIITFGLFFVLAIINSYVETPSNQIVAVTIEK
jgi:heme/copper-type cytochrome/quinol oxidase subunit 2